MEEFYACPKCTSWTHTYKKCWRKRSYICGAQEGNHICQKKHDPLLHGAKNHYCLANAAQRDRPVMLLPQEIVGGAVGGKEITFLGFYDNGSTLSLVRHRSARQAGLPSTPYKLGLRVVGKSNYDQVDTGLYMLALKNTHGGYDIVQAIGMDSISQVVKGPWG